MSKSLFKITQILSSLSLILALVISPLFALLLPTPAYAQIDTSSCATAGLTLSVDPTTYQYVPGAGDTITLTVTSGLNAGTTYVAGAYGDSANSTKSAPVVANAAGAATLTFAVPSFAAEPRKWTLKLFISNESGSLNTSHICDFGIIETSASGSLNCQIKVSQFRPNGSQCFLSGDGSGCLSPADIKIEATITDSNGDPVANKAIDVAVKDGLGWIGTRTNASGVIEPVTFKNLAVSSSSTGDYKVSIGVDGWWWNTEDCKSIPFTISSSCTTSTGEICGEDTGAIDSDEESGSTTSPTKYDYKICDQIGDETEEGAKLKGQCIKCATEGGGDEQLSGIWTAVGCIKRDPKSIVERFVEIGMGLGGGVCLLTCLAGGFMITTSQGEPKKINDAKEMITNALIGLLFILFSVVILQFIGVTIFNIPGFGTNPTATP